MIKAEKILKNSNMNIKVLQDTPFHKAGHILSDEQFGEAYLPVVREAYPAIFNKNNKDKYLELELAKYSDWFEIVQDLQFHVGDWVYHELLQSAFFVADTSDTKTNRMWPSTCSLDAVNTYLRTYKRLATKDEIELAKLVPYCGGKILVGFNSCYYFDNTWIPITGVKEVVRAYVNANFALLQKSVKTQASSHDTYTPKISELKIGCLRVSSEDLDKIAKQLNIT